MNPSASIESLIQQARAAREHAHASYSHFKVGAALLADDGQVFTGCNVENATYGLTICAERVAVFKALSEGVRKFAMIAIITATHDLTPPCGACRQIIWEFCGDIPVVMANLDGKREQFQMSSLLPRPFDLRYLEQNK